MNDLEFKIIQIDLLKEFCKHALIKIYPTKLLN